MLMCFEIRSSICDDETFRFCIDYCINIDATMVLREIRASLEEFGIFISLSVLCRFFKKENVTLKKICSIAKEANPSECSMFWDLFRILCTDIKQCIWGDESHRDDKTVNRKRGRAPKLVL